MHESSVASPRVFLFSTFVFLVGATTVGAQTPRSAGVAGKATITAGTIWEEDFSAFDPTPYYIDGTPGSAVASEGNFSLTEQGSHERGRIFLESQQRMHTFVASFSLHLGYMSVGGDGAALVWCPSYDYPGSTGGALDATCTGGFLVGFDTHEGGGYAPDRVYVAHDSTDPTNRVASADVSDLEDDEWHAAEVTLHKGGVVGVRLDGNTVIDRVPIPGYAPFDGYLGFAAATGSYNALQRVDDISIYVLPEAGGDLDHDFFTDLVVGARGGAGTSCGGINTIYGSVGGLTVTGQGYFEQGNGGVPDACETLDGFGRAVAVGDFDGDGFSDVAVGAPWEDIYGSNEGAVFVLYGRTGGLSGTDSQMWVQGEDGVHGTPEDDDQFGEVLAVGDFDGDGHDDLAIGVPGEDYTGVGEGVVQVLFGTTEGLSSTDNQEFKGANCSVFKDNARFGGALAVGDFDNDGYDELVVGAPGYPVDAVADAGSVTVLEGGGDGLLYGNICFDQTDFDQEDNDTLDYFGFALAVGDFDGDGRDDLAVGVIGEDLETLFVDWAGAVRVLFNTGSGLGVSGSQVLTQDDLPSGDPEFGDSFGWVLTAADLNSDGYSDLAVGTFTEWVVADKDGVVDILWGGSDGINAATAQRLDQDMLANSDGNETHDFFGHALASGDFNHDGHGDLAIGTPGEDVAGSDKVGRVYLVYGTGSGLSTDNDVFDQCSGSAGGCTAGNEFGYALAAVPRPNYLFIDGFESGGTCYWSSIQ